MTVRLTVRPLENGRPAALNVTGALAQETTASTARQQPLTGTARVRAGDLVVRFTGSPPTLHVETPSGAVVQTLDARRGRRRAVVPAAEGSAARPRRRRRAVRQEGLDRSDAQRPGHVAAPMATGWRFTARARRFSGSSARDGWAMFIHQPYGAFDFKGAEGRFTAAARRSPLPARRLRRALARSAGHHARVRAHHRAAGNAGALDVRLHAVVAHARRPGRDPRRRARRSARRSCRATR